MKTMHSFGFAAVMLAAFAVAAPAAGQGVGPADVNAVPGPANPQGRSDTQRDAEAAFAQARAECRRVPREERRACVEAAQREHDADRRALGPRRDRRPSAAPAVAAPR